MNRCGFCQRRGHNISGCTRFKKITHRLEGNILTQFHIDTFKQMLRLIDLLRADVDFLLKEMEDLPDYSNYEEQ